jgi:hypothetical protein
MVFLLQKKQQNEPSECIVGVKESAALAPSADSKFRTSLWFGTLGGFCFSNDPKDDKREIINKKASFSDIAKS